MFQLTADAFPEQTYHDLAIGLPDKVAAYMAQPGQLDHYREWLNRQRENGNPYGVDFDEL